MLLFLGISKFFLYLVPFSVLIISRSTLFPFIVGKGIYMRFMVELALLFYVLYLIFERHTSPYGNKLFWEEHSYIFKSGIFWTVTIFIAVFSLSAFTGVYFKTSFWANFERGEGVFQFLHYYLFFLLGLLVLKTKSDWKRLFIFSIITGIILNLYGFAQIWGVEGVVSSGQTRMQGTLGNPAYVGAYLLFGMFYVAYLF